MTPVDILPGAQEYLLGIFYYSADRWGTEQADRYIRGLHEAIALVANAPNLRRPCNEIRRGYFRVNSGSHVIFCRLRGDTIEVIRVLHAGMDFRRHL